jgi:hypothetical protein
VQDNGRRPRRVIIILGLTLAGIVVAAAAYHLLYWRANMIVGVAAPQTADSFRRLVLPDHIDIVWRQSDGYEFVLSSRCISSFALLRRLRGNKNVTFARRISGSLEDYGADNNYFGETIPINEALKNVRVAANEAIHRPGVANVVTLRISVAELRWEALRSKKAVGSIIKVTPDLQLLVGTTSTRKESTSTLEIGVTDSNGNVGKFELTNLQGLIYAELLFDDKQISLTPIEGDEYLLIRREFSKLPPESDLGDSAPGTSSKYIPTLVSTTSSPAKHAIRVLIGFTDTAALSFLLRPKSGTPPTEKELTAQLTNIFAYWNHAFDKYEGRAFTIQRVLSHVQQPEALDAAHGLNLLCRPSSNQLPGASQVRKALVESSADVAVLVVDNLCELQKTDDPCGHVEVLACADDSPATCGLSAKIGADVNSAISIVAESCVATGSIFHEIGHLLGGQHSRPIAEHSTPYAHAHVDSLPDIKPWMTLMATAKECSYCDRLPIWSSATASVDRQRKAGTGKITRPGGSEREDNLRVILQNWSYVEGFGDARRSTLCLDAQSKLSIKFNFNQPNLRIPLTRRDVVLIDGAVEDLREKSGDVSRILRACNALQVRVSGFTDEVSGPTDDYNDLLSRVRAVFATQELIRGWPEELLQRVCDVRGRGVATSRLGFSMAREEKRRADIEIGEDICARTAARSSF